MMMMVIIKSLFVISALLTVSLGKPRYYDAVSYYDDDAGYQEESNGDNNEQGYVAPDDVFERGRSLSSNEEEEKEKTKDNIEVGIVTPDDDADGNNVDSFDKDEYSDGNSQVDLPKNGDLFEGDIVMDERFRRMVSGDEESKKSAVAHLDEMSMMWPNGEIVFEIDKNFPNASRTMLHHAMEEYKNRTCISFKKRTNEANYVYFTDWKNECSSNIGMSGGRQNITLGHDCHVDGTYEHEIMHALGFIHEHSRPDRDDYIHIEYVNIKKAEWLNFQKYTFRQVNTWNMTFNFASIMLYRNNAFSKNDKDTIKAVTEPSLKFGQRIKFSAGDIKEINTLYHCKGFLQHPNYHGLFKEYHTQRKKDVSASEKKKKKKKDMEKKKQQRDMRKRREEMRRWVYHYLLGRYEGLGNGFK